MDLRPPPADSIHGEAPLALKLCHHLSPSLTLLSDPLLLGAWWTACGRDRVVARRVDVWVVRGVDVLGVGGEGGGGVGGG